MKIGVLDDYLQVAAELADWSSLTPRCDVRFLSDHIGDQEELAKRLQEFDVICLMRERTPISGQLIDRLDTLKLIVTSGMYNASVDLGAATSKGIVVSGTRGILSPMPELAWGLLLALARDIPANDKTIRTGDWSGSLGGGLAGKTLGLIGLGRSGSKMARFGAAFDMNVLAWSPNLDDSTASEASATKVDLLTLLESSDFVSIHVRLGERSRSLIDHDKLRLMKPTAFLINTARGPIVVEEDLIAALDSGLIAGAGLDVYESEPIEQDNPLLNMDNVVLLPHMGYVTRENFEVFYQDTVEDIQAFLNGAPIRVIDPSDTR